MSGQKFGITPVWASEIEPWPIKVTQKHFPDMKHLGDITKINGAEIEPVDVVTFGSPCFPAGTLVITENGYAPIEKIMVGDRVLTHTGKWQKVLNVGGKVSDTITLKGFGHYGLETTVEHPFYSSEKIRKWRNKPSRGWDSEMTNPEWVEAQHMEGKFWATPIIVENLEIPVIKKGCGSGKRAEIPEMNESFWWFIGRWLGDGWVRNGKRSGRPSGWGQIFLCCSHSEKEEVKERIKKLGIVWMETEERTVTKFRTTNQSLTNWILDNFGQHADGKHLPAWVLSLPVENRETLLRGYMSADGYIKPDGTYSATTVSRGLGLGIRLVAESLGYSSTLYFSKMKPKTTIEGRAVNQKDFYTVRYATVKKQTSRTEAHGVSWGKVRRVLPGRHSVQVFNLEVEEDNSYVVENIIVHNCQDMSVAGKRAGLAGERSGLFMEAVRIIREMRDATNGSYPRFAVWENVPGAFSSNAGQDFRAVLEEITETKIPIPASGKWATAGMVRTSNCDLAFRTIDAQHWGVPQRRRRIFLVADFGGQCASEILFEREGLPWNSEESREAREEVAGAVGYGIKGTDYLTGWDCQEKRIFTDKGVAPTIAGSDGGGGRTGVGYVAKQINSTPEGIAGTVSSKWAKGTGVPAGDECYDLVIEPRSQDGVCRVHTEGIVPTLNTAGGGQRQPCVISCVTKQISQNIGFDVAMPLMTEDYKEPQVVCIQNATRGKSQNGLGISQDDVSDTLDSLGNHAVAYSLQGSVYGLDLSQKAEGIGMKKEVSACVSPGTHPGHGNHVLFPDVSMCLNTKNNRFDAESQTLVPVQLYDMSHAEEVMRPVKAGLAPTLNSRMGTGGNKLPVMLASTVDCRNLYENEELSATLQSKPNGGQSLNYINPVRVGYAVRRLTPKECLKLQGYPDWWLDIDGMSDTAKYKAAGNSVATVCTDFVMGGIAKTIKEVTP